MKKLIMAIILAIGIIISQTAQMEKAEAYNYFVGVYPVTGLKGYLMTESVYRLNDGYRCTVVCYPSNRAYYIDYTFWIRNGSMYYSNSDGYSGRIRNGYDDPVEYNTYRAILNKSY